MLFLREVGLIIAFVTKRGESFIIANYIFCPIHLILEHFFYFVELFGVYVQRFLFTVDEVLLLLAAFIENAVFVDRRRMVQLIKEGSAIAVI
jgi:hypothetical protein